MKNEVQTSYAVSQVLMEIIMGFGLSPEKIQKQIGISPLQVMNPDSWIPMRAFSKLWETAIDLTGDPALALNIRRKTGVKMVHFVVQLMMHSSNFLESLSHLSRYARSMSDADRFEIIDRDELLEVIYSNTASEIQIRWLPEHNFSLGMELGRLLSGNDHIKPVEVSFQHPDPGYRSAYEEVFGPVVRFDAQKNSIVLEKNLLMQPISNRDGYLQKIFRSYAEASLKKRTGTRSVQNRVIDHIAAALPAGTANIKTIALKMNMTRSTLYRHLKKEGCTFQELLVRTRQQTAEYHLKKGLSISQVGYLVGFSEPAAFHRAFKKWTGVNPGEYRRHSNDATDQ